MNHSPAPIRVEVDLDAVEHNVREVRKLVGDDVRVMAVVKADAYGHGAVETSKAVVAAGADAVAVTRLEEALELRAAGVTHPILVFDSTLPELAEQAVAANLEQTVCTTELAEAMSRAAAGQGKTARVHVKVDTGMGRLGILPKDASAFVGRIASLPAIEVAGTYTHFATAIERDLGQTRGQLRTLQSVLAELRAAGLPVGLAHAANSAALVRLPESRLDMVRPGTLLYGQYPSRFVPKMLDLRETWRLVARISFVKSLPPGHAVGYGAEFRTRRESIIAIVPIGYADGLTMAPESLLRRQMSLSRQLLSIVRPRIPLQVVIHGRKAPIVGRVAMQMCAVDVTDIPGVQVGDQVVLPARRLAVSSRVPKVYVRGRLTDDDDQP
jgi:alanine racemase